MKLYRFYVNLAKNFTRSHNLLMTIDPHATIDRYYEQVDLLIYELTISDEDYDFVRISIPETEISLKNTSLIGPWR